MNQTQLKNRLRDLEYEYETVKDETLFRDITAFMKGYEQDEALPIEDLEEFIENWTFPEPDIWVSRTLGDELDTLMDQKLQEWKDDQF